MSMSNVGPVPIISAYLIGYTGIWYVFLIVSINIETLNITLTVAWGIYTRISIMV